jgi:transposase-like protein
MLNGEDVRVLAEEYSIGSGTLYRWRRQALIDAGRSPGVASYQPDPLGTARRRIKDLEAELEAVKLASELFAMGGVDPKGSSRL